MSFNIFGYHVSMSPFYRTLCMFKYDSGTDWWTIVLPFGVLTVETVESWKRVY